jgi:hypothetical protein
MNVEKEVLAIKDRNQSVEIDKAWETSWTRRGLILGMTYIVTTIVFYLLRVENFWLNSFIPTVGYLLSTLTIPVAKSVWVKKYKRNLGE